MTAKKSSTKKATNHTVTTAAKFANIKTMMMTAKKQQH